MDKKQSDFALHFQLRCSNPSGVLADTTSLCTREALVRRNSAGTVKDWGCHASTPQSPMATAPLTGEPRSALTKASPERGGGAKRRRGHSISPAGTPQPLHRSDFTRPTGGFHFATGKISPAHRADFTEGGMPPSYALQVNSVTGPQDFSSTSTSAVEDAAPLPSLLTMMVIVPFSPFLVPLWKYT